MKTKLIMAALSLFLVVASAPAQTEQPQSRPMSKWKNGKETSGLKLTDQQKKDAQKIKFDLMQKQIDLRAKIAHARLDYQQLTSADSPDESAIAEKIDDIAKLKVESKKNMLDSWFAVNKILTPDQQKIWKKVLQHPRMARGMMMRMRTNRGNGANRMQWRRPNVGAAPMMDNGPALGEGPDNDLDQLDYSGPMAYGNMFFMNDDSFLDNLDMLDEPMMEQSGATGDQMEMMNGKMDQATPDQPAPDVAK
jgi:Spy/CpxP family protein refolding chaperone